MALFEAPYLQAQERFERNEGHLYQSMGASATNYDVCAHWFIRKADQRVCIVQFYRNGGYAIFEQMPNGN